LIQSTKFPLRSHGTREIKGCQVPSQAAIGQRRGDVSQLEKPEIGKEQTSLVVFVPVKVSGTAIYALIKGIWKIFAIQIISSTI
jgi:hypothetical protein